MCILFHSPCFLNKCFGYSYSVLSPPLFTGCIGMVKLTSWSWDNGLPGHIEYASHRPMDHEDQQSLYAWEDCTWLRVYAWRWVHTLNETSNFLWGFTFENTWRFYLLFLPLIIYSLFLGSQCPDSPTLSSCSQHDADSTLISRCAVCVTELSHLFILLPWPQCLGHGQGQKPSLPN